MPQRLPVVRMFNLGTFACIDSVIYNWGSETLIVKIILHNGKYNEVDLGFRPVSRFKALLKDRGRALKFINSLAEVLACATGQSFDSVSHPLHRERIWFFKYTACGGG